MASPFFNSFIDFDGTDLFFEKVYEMWTNKSLFTN
jgi:hypothetical protein